MADEWDYYHTQIDGKSGMVAVNLGLAAESPQASRPWLLRLGLKLRTPDALPGEEEAAALNKFEEALLPQMAGEVQAVYVGRTTVPGRRNMYFYAPDPGWYVAVCRAVLSDFEGWEPDFEKKQDAGWSTYEDFLFPNPRQLRTIFNRRTVVALLRAGDDTAKPRPVDHVLFFNSPAGRQRFSDAVTAEGFTIVEHVSGADDDMDAPAPLLRPPPPPGFGGDREPGSTGDTVVIDALMPENAEQAADAGLVPSGKFRIAPIGGPAPAAAAPAAAEAPAFEEEDDEGGDDEHPYRLELSRVDSVDLPNINAVVDSLLVRASELGGVYKGWAAPVVKSAEE